MTLATKLQREQISTAEGVIMNGRHRVRLLPTAEVPVLRNLKSLIGTEVIVFDLPKAEGIESKYLDSNKNSFQKMKKQSEFDYLNEDKENALPDGCTLAGDPLHVSFLTIEKLEKHSKHANTKYGNANIVESIPFKTHLLTSLEALDLINDLDVELALDENLNNLACVALADGSNCNNLLFLTRQKSNKLMTTFKAMLLGNIKGAMAELNAMTMQLQVYHIRRCIYRCSFDVLRDVILFQQPPNFVPASFIIEAEWGVSLPKTRGQRKTILFENFLSMPPDNARVTIKFKPGWMDERVALTTNIYELKHLADLASALKVGKIPWTEKELHPHDIEVDDDSDFLLQRVAELIENARDKPDIEAVYPFDFADRLWDIIRIVKSMETLKKAFEMIYDELRTGEFRVMVEADKVSSLAKMLRVRTVGNMVFPRLEPLTCLQMLVEIGVDRFKGDIQYRFLKDEFISNASDLEPFFLHLSAPVEDHIEQLMPLYLALQSMLMIEKFVRLTPHKKMLMAKRLLAHFTAVKNVDSNAKEFSFDASMEDIHREGLKTSMNEWVIGRVYEKQSKSSSDTGFGTLGTPTSGAIYEIVCLSKYIGFEYLTQVSFNNTKQAPKQDDMISVKQEANSFTPSPINSSKNKGRTGFTGFGDVTGSENTTAITEEPEIEELFDCVYVTGTSNSLFPFLATTISARPSPVPSPDPF